MNKMHIYLVSSEDMIFNEKEPAQSEEHVHINTLFELKVEKFRYVCS